MDKDIFDFIFENSQISDDLKENFVLEFPKFDKDKIYKNFTNEAFKGDDFFVHFEEIYKNLYKHYKDEIINKIIYLNKDESIRVMQIVYDIIKDLKLMINNQQINKPDYNNQDRI